MGLMGTVLLGVGAVSLLGYFIWLLIRSLNWDSKIPPAVGILLSLVMLAGGLSSIPMVQNLVVNLAENGIRGVIFPQGEGAPDDSEPSPDPGIWYVNYYTDEFEQTTDSWYITAPAFSGTFNDSANANKKMTAEVLTDGEGEVVFRLFKLRKSLVKNTFTSFVMAYNITMRTPDGAERQMTGVMDPNSDRLRVDSAGREAVLTALRGEGPVSFYVEEAESSIRNYSFSVETDNFDSVYQFQTEG